MRPGFGGIHKGKSLSHKIWEVGRNNEGWGKDTKGAFERIFSGGFYPAARLPPPTVSQDIFHLRVYTKSQKDEEGTKVRVGLNCLSIVHTPYYRAMTNRPSRPLRFTTLAALVIAKSSSSYVQFVIQLAHIDQLQQKN